jgi:uncharacterized glyoxalase superfamily protein PhnB
VAEIGQRAVPMLSYEDGAAAVDWLTRAFGFREEQRLEEEGKVTHATLVLDDAVVMLGTPSPEYRDPEHHREECEQARRWSEVPYVIDGVLVYVEDVYRHFERARGEGANVLMPPTDTDYGLRNYVVEDYAGHRWLFAQPL